MNAKKFFKNLGILLVATIWIFSGVPRLFDVFPPAVPEANADEFTVTTSPGAGPSPVQSAQNGTSPTTVFIDNQYGYTFYVGKGADGSGTDCFVRYTSSAGAGSNSWGQILDLTPGIGNSNCTGVAVWYDQWTPGNTGNLIHIATLFGNPVNEVRYEYLNTNYLNNWGSFVLGPIPSAGVNSGQNNIFPDNASPQQNYVSITESTDGLIYIAVNDDDVTNSSFIVRCNGTFDSCQFGINWVEMGADNLPFDKTLDQALLMPLPNGNIMAIRYQLSSGLLQSRVFCHTSIILLCTGVDTWDTTWKGIDGVTAANEYAPAGNYDYRAQFGATVYKSTGDIYVGFAINTATLGGGDDGVKVRRYNVATNAWGGGVPQPVTNYLSPGGITGAKIAVDENTGTLYIVYTAQANTANPQTGDVYFIRMINQAPLAWSTPVKLNINSVTGLPDSGDMYGARFTITGRENIYMTWLKRVAVPTSQTIFGTRAADPAQLEQSGYRWFNDSSPPDLSVGAPIILGNPGYNAPINAPPAGRAFRLRFLLHNLSSLPTSTYQTFGLQYAPKGGAATCGAVPYASYASVTGSSLIHYYNYQGAGPIDGTSLPSPASDSSDDPKHPVPPAPADTTVNQIFIGSNTFTFGTTYSIGKDGKWDTALTVDNTAPALTTYCFRVVSSDGSLLKTYSQYPELTTADYKTLTINVNPTGYGRVDLTGPITGNCTSSCVFYYAPSETATLTAAETQSGIHFENWVLSAGCVGITCNILMSSDAAITANFTKYDLTVSITPSPSGTVTITPFGGSGTLCSGSGCVQTYSGLTEQPVSLQANNVGSWQPDSPLWTGGCSGTTNPCSLNMATPVAGPQSVTAHFLNSNILTVTIVGYGTVTGIKSGVGTVINCTRSAGGQSGTCTFSGSGNITFSQVATGWTFNNWTDCIPGVLPCTTQTTSPYNLTMNSSHTLTATFCNDASNIDCKEYNHWAWNDVIGWIDFYFKESPNVYVDLVAGELRGYASSSVGYIALNCHTPPSGATANCPIDYKVSVDTATSPRKLSGWAWNDVIGWISFCGDDQGGSTLGGTTWLCPNRQLPNSLYGVTIDASGNFSGWAWNDVVGWISFNCNNLNTCGTVNYKVKANFPVLAPTANLYSNVFDMGGTATLNSIMWLNNFNCPSGNPSDPNCNVPAGTSVYFKIASSNCANGTNQDFFPSCMGGSWNLSASCLPGLGDTCFQGPPNPNPIESAGYGPTVPGVPVRLTSDSYNLPPNPPTQPTPSSVGHANKRYVRYEIIITTLGGATPVINDVIINYSP